MANFLVYDLAFLVIFTIWVIWFLYTRKHNLKREGIIYLYRTSLGIKFIEYIGGKYKRTIKVSQYLAISLGYVLMIAILWVLIFTVYTYVKYPQITDTVKAPPVLPLIPYFPSLFGLSSFFPPLYFTYWIIALLVVAAVHEFSHGIFAHYHGLKIKSTGFAFLGPVLGAFVEPDEKEMVKKGKIAQLSILSAGVFANIVTAAIFFFILWGLFVLTFAPSGVIISAYASGSLNIDNITYVNGMPFKGDFNNLLDGKNTKIQTKNVNFTIPTELLKEQLDVYEGNLSGKQIKAYIDAPAVNNNIGGAISKINDDEIKSVDDLNNAFDKYSPGDKVIIETRTSNETKTYNVTLAANPNDKSKPFLGIYLSAVPTSGFRGLIANTLFFKDPNLFYQEQNAFFAFFYYLVWWIVMINFFVALFNMLPVGILDGGRFFYLTVLGIVKSEKATKITYKITAYFILAIFILMMFAWVFAIN